MSSTNRLPTETEGTDGAGQSRAVTIGRYLLHRQIARGGMATIHIARLMGDEGFSRIVAAKRLLPEFAEDTDFVSMFMDEARIASKVHHRNVVPVLDLVTTADEVMLVQEYVHGVPAHVLLRTAKQAKLHIAPRIAVAIAMQVLAGLHAAHETTDEIGEPLGIVHRDVSPQNVMVAVDGTARLLDFGVAKATMAAHVTRDGTFKGKLAYSAPEQLRGQASRQSDVYALAVMLWELLVGHRMHQHAQGDGELVTTIMQGTIPSVVEALANEREWDGIDDATWRELQAVSPIVQRGMAVDLTARYPTAGAMEDALAALPAATSSELSAWVKSLGKEYLEGRDKVIAAEETSWRRTQPVGRTVPIAAERGRTGAIRTEVTLTGAVPAAAQSGALAPVTRRRGRLVPVLAALVIMLAVGLVLAMRGGSPDAASSSSSSSSSSSPSPDRPVAPGSAREATAAEPPAPAVAAPPTASASDATVERITAGLPAPTAGTAVAPPPVTPAEPAPRGRPRAPDRKPREREAKVAPVDAKPAPAPGATTDKAAVDCTPPYYFEGQKKIFKPQCL